MSLSQREKRLGWITAIALLLGLTYWVTDKKMSELKEIKAEKETISRRITRDEHLIGQKDRLLNALKSLKGQLPAQPIGKDVSAPLLQRVEALANKANLQLKTIDPGKEKKLGELGLYELAVTCSWQGTLEAMVRFLYDLQSQGAVLDVKQLSMTPMTKPEGYLKGNFIIDFAFSRVTGSGSPLNVTPQ